MQQLILAFQGNQFPGELLRRYRPGAVILYPENLTGGAGKELVKAMRQEIPNLRVLIDQEGGPFFTYRDPGVARFPAPMSLGAAGDPELAYRVGAGLAQQIREIGADVNLAPVLDLRKNPLDPIIGMRSLGSDPLKVAELGEAFIKGSLAGGVLPCAKHFPGHGGASSDSHLGAPQIEADITPDLIPFRRLAGLVPLMMSAHVVYPSYDAVRPATRSPVLLKSLLRGELGFKGRVISDDLAMAGFSVGESLESAAGEALQAGVDYLIAPRDPDGLAAVVWALLRAPARECSWPQPPEISYPAQDLEGLALEASRRGVTWLRGVLPIPGAGTLVLAPPISDRYGREPSLADLAGRFLPGSQGVNLASLSPGEIARAQDLVRQSERVVLASFHWLGEFPVAQQELYAALRETGKPIYVVALGNPDDINWYIPNPEGYICTYGYRSPQLQAALEALSGSWRPSGQLPIPAGPYPAGFGLT